MLANVISLYQEKKHEHMWAKKYYDQILESRTVKVLGIVIDDEKFDEYMINVCKKTQRKLIVLTKIDFKNTYISMNCDFGYQFKYCPLT